ncbi:MAG: hypothetical protein V1850_07800 [Candidatus Bathyarchaeota archaeon]
MLALAFGAYALVVNYYGLLTATVGTQIIASLATSSVVIVTLGSRIIDDALNRYEKYAFPRIVNLRNVLDTPSTKKEVSDYNPINLAYRSQELNKTSSELEKYGRYFFTKLYPVEPLNKIKTVTQNLDVLSKKFNDLNSRWNDEKTFSVFLEVLFRNGSFGSLHNLTPDSYHFLEEKSDALKKEHSELIISIETLRDELLISMDELLAGLNDFLNAN